MNSPRVELLAPAGNYDSFIGAMNAGADAVYVGGEKFSARAFADNFDTDTLCQCIKYAHLFGRRVYLTLNTLIKESEFSEIYEYVKPFYLAGLDGVIIQDFGVLKFLKEHFPHMELHASTQMAVTGPEFVSLCKDWGISRVVPARELSLSELKAIRDAGIEVECFIHGAMCYCYSGMCLMSSILGGRSGNRGKCAQPCRLPYQVADKDTFSKDTYTLSLKDMCTIEHIPALIEAGMDSFKIEGRMKRSEYAAGVTALYRKYIDSYYRNPDKPFKISKEDRKVLENLYMRSELHDGYLFKHNGKEMVTKDAPSYSGSEDAVLADISAKYLGYTLKLPVSMYGYFEVGQPSVLTIYTADGDSVTINGPVVEEAQKSPATEEAVSKQLSKLGNTHFTLQDMDISIVGNVFLPNGIINALRREAIEQLEAGIISSKFPEVGLRECIAFHSDNSIPAPEEAVSPLCSVLVSTKEQAKGLWKHPIMNQIGTVYLEEDALEWVISDRKQISNQYISVYAMPYILRNSHIQHIHSLLLRIKEAGITHVLARNVEELALISKFNQKSDVKFSVITDASLYCWNLEAKKALEDAGERITLPYELNNKELRPLRSRNTEQIIYGYIPLMTTSNCIFKTNYNCQIAKGTGHRAFLKDRYGKIFTAVTNCKYCYNNIYNSVPLSLHKKYNKNCKGTYRLQFTIETSEEMNKILSYYNNWIQDISDEFPVKEYTTAHENRQVE